MINYDELRKDIINSARAYLNVPYRHQGRNKAGIDCVGLILKAYQDAGVNEFCEETNKTDYSRWPSNDSLLNRIRTDTFEVDIADVKPTDIFLMKWPEIDNFPRHVSMITKVGTLNDSYNDIIFPSPMNVIQTHWRVMSVSEHRLDRQWYPRVISAHRHNIFKEET